MAWLNKLQEHEDAENLSLFQKIDHIVVDGEKILPSTVGVLSAENPAESPTMRYRVPSAILGRLSTRLIRKQRSRRDNYKESQCQSASGTSP
jgi:hypothetical protein